MKFKINWTNNLYKIFNFCTPVWRSWCSNLQFMTKYYDSWTVLDAPSKKIFWVCTGHMIHPSHDTSSVTWHTCKNNHNSLHSDYYINIRLIKQWVKTTTQTGTSSTFYKMLIFWKMFKIHYWICFCCFFVKIYVLKWYSI